jgi:DNA-binding CsgD family transcriptional regulator
MLKDIRKRLRELPAASFDWNEYLRLFDEIHPSALAILQQQYPDLSPTESKICSLVLAKLSNVDIARLLACSERTVENHRHRLRKKLGLAAGVDLTAFLERTLSENPKRTGELAATSSVQ